MFKKAVILILVFVFAALPNILLAQETLSLPALREEAVRNNPEILAAKKQVEAAKARIPIAKSLDDPVLTFEFEKIPKGTAAVSKTPADDRMLSFSQFLPFFGKLSLKGKIAFVESRMFIAEYKNKELEVINSVEKAYYELFMNVKEIELNEYSLKILDGIAGIAQARYATNELPQEELFKIHLEIARLNTVLLNLKEETKAIQTRLNTLLNRDAEAALGGPALSEDVSFKQDIKLLYLLTMENNPELDIFRLAIEKNQYAHKLAKRSFFPDLMAQITQRGITSGAIGPWDLMLAFTVPLWFWTKQRYQVKEAIANLDEAKAAYEAMRNKAFSETKELFAKVKIAENNVALFRSKLIPLLESSINASLAAYRSGGGDVMALLDNIRMLIDTKMSLYKVFVDYYMNVSDLQRQVGKDLI